MPEPGIGGREEGSFGGSGQRDPLVDAADAGKDFEPSLSDIIDSTGNAISDIINAGTVGPPRIQPEDRGFGKTILARDADGTSVTVGGLNVGNLGNILLFGVIAFAAFRLIGN